MKNVPSHLASAVGPAHTHFPPPKHSDVLEKTEATSSAAEAAKEAAAADKKSIKIRMR